MRGLLIVVVLLIVGIVGLGFYRGWFQVSSNRDNEDQKVNTTFTVDEERIEKDKEKLQGVVDGARDEPVETNENTK
jgi:hypothetical protein